MENVTEAKAKQITLEAVIIRADGSKEDLGTIAYWNKNPLKRLVHRLLHGKTGTIR